MNLNSELSRHIAKVYSVTGLGLLITALVTILIPSLGVQDWFITVKNNRESLTYFGIFMIFVPIMLAFPLAFIGDMIGPVGPMSLYGVFCASFGVSFYIITSHYTLGSIFSAFFLTAGLFFGLSFIGFAIKKPLTGLYSVCMIGLWAMILVMISELIFHFTINQLIMNVLILGIFSGLTVIDSKNIVADFNMGNTSLPSIIQSSVNLYLDVINLFASILEITGIKSSD